MSKELEALEKIIDTYCIDNIDKEISIIATALKDYEMEHTLRIRLENAIYELLREKQENEKKLKALEIIKEKGVNVGLLSRCSNAERYNKGMCYEPRYLTQEEYGLLKEVLL